jgi:hypothetical protein
MTKRLQDLRETYTEAYLRLFTFINDRDPLMLREFINQDELYQREEEE